MNTTKDVSDSKKKITKGEVISALIIFSLLGAVGWQIITLPSISGGSSSASVTPSELPKHSDIDAFVDAQSVVTKTLKAPSTAKYPYISEAEVKHTKNDEFLVSSYVDSQNGFGATIRSEWAVLFAYTDDGDLNIYQVVIDGKELYRKKGF